MRSGNPDDLARSVGALNRKIRTTREGLQKLLKDNPLVKYQKALIRVLDDMNWWERNISKRGERKSLEKRDNRATKIRADHLTTVLLSLQKWSDSMGEADDEGLQQAVVYYRGDSGQGELKAYYTGDVRLHSA